MTLLMVANLMMASPMHFAAIRLCTCKSLIYVFANVCFIYSKLACKRSASHSKWPFSGLLPIFCIFYCFFIGQPVSAGAVVVVAFLPA